MPPPFWSSRPPANPPAPPGISAPTAPAEPASLSASSLDCGIQAHIKNAVDAMIIAEQVLLDTIPSRPFGYPKESVELSALHLKRGRYQRVGHATPKPSMIDARSVAFMNGPVPRWSVLDRPTTPQGNGPRKSHR